MKTILIVEDNELNIDLLTQLLEEDYRLLTARDGAQAVQLVGEIQPDMVLMDISLPVMDGCEATRRIHQAFPFLPVIGLSANAMREDIGKAIEAGCADYITKPIDEHILFEKLKLYLGRG
jgi:two-component system, cell cycle response regulator DivK